MCCILYFCSFTVCQLRVDLATCVVFWSETPQTWQNEKLMCEVWAQWGGCPTWLPTAHLRLEHDCLLLAPPSYLVYVLPGCPGLAPPRCPLHAPPRCPPGCLAVAPLDLPLIAPSTCKLPRPLFGELLSSCRLRPDPLTHVLPRWLLPTCFLLTPFRLRVSRSVVLVRVLRWFTWLYWWH